MTASSLAGNNHVFLVYGQWEAFVTVASLALSYSEVVAFTESH